MPDARPTLADDSMSVITRVPGGPTEGQIRTWVKLGYLKPVRKGIPGQVGNYNAFDPQERFVAVVIARLLRVHMPAKLAVPLARKAWLHKNGSHRVTLDDGIVLTFTTKADGSAR